MASPREYRDRSKDSIFTLLGELPELVRNLVIAEIDAAKEWARRTGKDAGIAVALFVGALFFLFWAVPVFGTFIIAGLSSWWPVWLSALVVFGVLLVIAIVLAGIGALRFRVITQRRNPIDAISEDIREVRDEF